MPPEAFTSDPDRLARFEREAKVLASLNHTNIGHIYGLEESEPSTSDRSSSGQVVRALVLELVEGPTLADRIAKGPIPIDEALPIAKQITEALEVAHEAGVIHRDLKPANIKVREDGTVKVLDFGLAKAFAADTPAADTDLSQSPTVTAGATRANVIIGTAAYMAPEQARGKPVDKRADIWAFGCVLYEMLTGRRAFAGEDASQTMARVIESDPDWSRLPRDLGPVLETYLRACLHKDVRQRVRDIGDLRLAFEGRFQSAGASFATSASFPDAIRRALPVTVAAMAVVAAATGLTVWTMRSPEPGRLIRFPISAPASEELRRGLALAPDGRTVAFSGRGAIFIRRLDRLDTVRLPRDDDALVLAFWPDGRSVLVASGEHLMTVPLDEQASAPLASVGQVGPAGGVVGATWGPDGTIVLGSDDGLRLMPATGGASRVVTVVGEGERSHQNPHYLPDGRAVLFQVLDADYDTHLAAYSFETGAWHRLLPYPATTPQFSTTGHLVFERDGALWAAPFDPGRLELLDDPVRTGEIDVMSVLTTAQFAVGLSGALVYRPDTGQRRLMWVNRAGSTEPLPAEPGQYDTPRVSPDGGRIAVQVGPFGDADVFVYDLSRDTLSRVTLDEGSSMWPIWGTTGEELFFASDRDGPMSVYRQRTDGAGAAERLTPDAAANVPMSLSPDGETLVLVRNTTGSTNTDIGAIRLEDPSDYRPLVATDSLDSLPEVSPDGRWLAYVSEVTGQAEVYVRPFPDVESGRWVISRDGGLSPVWAPDGRELFYRAASSSGEMMAVTIDTESGFSAGAPTALFEGPYLQVNIGRMRPWDVAPDGRFLMVQEQAGGESGQEAPDLVFIENWTQELLERVPVP